MGERTPKKKDGNKSAFESEDEEEKKNKPVEVGFDPRKTKISLEELGRHNSRTDAWIAIKGKVYDVTNFF